MGVPVFINRVRVTTEGGTWDSLTGGAEQVRIVHDTTRSLDTEPNEGTIGVYNLDPGTIAKITGVQVERTDWTPAQRAELLAKGASIEPLDTITDGFGLLNIELSWGFAESGKLTRADREAALSVGFTGQVGRGGARLVRSGLDRILTFTVQDGGQTLAAAEVVQQAGPTGFEGKSYAPGSRLADILADMINSVGLSADADKIDAQIVGAFQAKGLPAADARTIGGYNASGPVRPQIENFLRNLGLRWSIQLGELLILAEGDVIPGLVPIELSTAMANVLGEPQDLDPGLQVETQANTSAIPGRQTNIQTEALSGSYRIDNVQTRGDSFSGGVSTLRLADLAVF